MEYVIFCLILFKVLPVQTLDLPEFHFAGSNLGTYICMLIQVYFLEFKVRLFSVIIYSSQTFSLKYLGDRMFKTK